MHSKYRQKFYDLYSREILPIFVNYEQKRKQKLAKLLLYMTISIVVLLLCLSVFLPLIFQDYTPLIMIAEPITGFVFIILLIASIVAVCLLPSGMNKSFKKELKKACEPSFAKCFNNLLWRESDKFDSYIFRQSGLFSSFNTEEYDDIFTLSHEGVKIEVIETHLQDVQGSGKNRRYINVFKGVVIIFPSNKRVKAQTIVTTKGDRNIRNSITGVTASVISTALLLIAFIFMKDIFNTLLYGIVLLIFVITYIKAKRKNRMRDVKLEDVEFDRRFQVASEDQLEARYLITPAFMDRLKGLQTGFGTEKVKCSFFDDKIMFAISTRDDLFEVGNLFVPLSNSKQMTKFFNEITSILEMVDHFKLDQKIGL